MDIIYGMPAWVFYSIIAVILTYVLSVGGWVLARAGRNPLWILLLLIPWLNVIGIWLFAYVSWPAMAQQTENSDSDVSSPGGA